MRRVLTWGVLVLILLVAAALLHHSWALSKQSESTDNAQVESDVIPISSELAGRIVTLKVEDNQPVKKGDLLVEIDPSDYQSRLVQAEKALQSARQRERAAQAQLALTQSGRSPGRRAGVGTERGPDRSQHGPLARGQRRRAAPSGMPASRHRRAGIPPGWRAPRGSVTSGRRS